MTASVEVVLGSLATAPQFKTNASAWIGASSPHPRYPRHRPDQLAEKLGIPKHSMLRARAGVSYALMEAVASGDCGLPQEDLLSLAEKLLEIGSSHHRRGDAAGGGNGRRG